MAKRKAKPKIVAPPPDDEEKKEVIKEEKAVPKVVIKPGEKAASKPAILKVGGAKKRAAGGVEATTQFQPKLKKPGDLILSEEWNEMQSEIKDDLLSVVNAVDALSQKSNVILTSGIASHGVFVELNWPVMPHVMVSLSGLVLETMKNYPINCYAYDISTKGFRVYAQDAQGRVQGTVTWMAMGVS